MPTINQQKNLPSTLADDAPIPEQEDASNEDLESGTMQSEVAMRINLLGKLIIPPTAH